MNTFSSGIPEKFCEQNMSNMLKDCLVTCHQFCILLSQHLGNTTVRNDSATSVKSPAEVQILDLSHFASSSSSSNDGNIPTSVRDNMSASSR